MYNSIPCKIVAILTLGTLAFSGCKRGGAGDTATELAQVRSDLEDTRRKAADAEKKSTAAQQEVERMRSEVDLMKKQMSDKEVLSIQKDNQLKALQAQFTDRRDAITFADISATLQRGLNSVALDRYRQFVVDFPKSPLVADANRAINELAVTVDRESKERAALIDPRRTERDALKRFQDGVATVEEITPLIRQRSVADVVKILGSPNRTYRNGTELGYVDRIIDPTTGNRETLVITFSGDRAVSVRIGYRGREIKF
jgi:hypothetical protein